MKKTKSFENQLLVATPALEQPSLDKAVIYIYEHDAAGARGFMINQPLKNTLGEVFDQLNFPLLDATFENRYVLRGGPSHPQQGCMVYLEDSQLVISKSRDTLEYFCKNYTTCPDAFLFILGHMQWSPGQLERELFESHWLLAPICKDILFDLPFEDRWKAAGLSIGIKNLYLFSRQLGHA